MFKGIFFLLKYAWKYEKKYIPYQIVLQVLTALIPIIDIVFPKYIIDKILRGDNIQNVLYLITGMIMLNLMASMLASFLEGRIFLLQGSIFTKFQTMMADTLSKSDFQRLEDPKFLDTKAKAEKFLYANGQGFAVVLKNSFNILGKAFTFVGIIAVILTLNWWIVALFILLILLDAWYESGIRKQNIQWDINKAPIERKTSYFLDLIENFAFGKEIRIYNLKDWLVAKVNHHLLESEAFYKKQTKLLNRAQYISVLLNFILKGITYIYLAYCVIKSTIGIGDFTMYVNAMMNFSNAMKSLMESVLDIRQFSGYYDALTDYLNVPQTMYQGKNLPLPEGPYEIEFCDVSFCYPGQKVNALSHISLKLKYGEKLSIVGENGAGKTTFVKLLCRLYDPTQGKITLNGMNIQDINYDSYMGLICSVFQDYKLLAFTLKENVSFQHSSDVEDSYIAKLLEDSGLGEKVRKLPDGVNTYVYRTFSEEGFEPSGGEGQKISLARAVYKDSPIMVLDEPTAALDPRAEYEIYRKFSDLTKGKTTVFISHRMSSSKFCDHIAFFEDGQIIEYGTHDELMDCNGKYKDLFDMQAQFYI